MNMPDKAITLKDYLETATDASKRTRAITIVLVAASVLVGVGFLNSFSESWILNRLKQLGNKESVYTREKFGAATREDFDKPDLKFQYEELYRNLARSSVENAYVVRVPFFGVAFDVNDLGLLGGFGLITILMLLRLSLRSQIVSLRIGFKAARYFGDVSNFYDVLAARQVFVFPKLTDTQLVEPAQGKVEKVWGSFKSKLRGGPQNPPPQGTTWSATRHSVLWFVPRTISLIPFGVYSFVVVQDYLSRKYALILNRPRAEISLFLNVLFLSTLFFLGLWCISKWNEIDRLWNYYRGWVDGKVDPAKPDSSNLEISS
jgi:hypothetical protein